MTTVTRHTLKGGMLKLFNGRNLIEELNTTDKDQDEVEQTALDLIDQGEELDAIKSSLASLDDFDPDADPDEEWEGGSAVPKKYKDLYGKKQNCGDPIATAITEGVVTLIDTTKKNGSTGKPKKIVNPEALQAIQEANGIDGTRWEHLNPGMQVMNTSNVIRGLFWRGTQVTVKNAKFDLSKACYKLVGKENTNGDYEKAILSCGAFPTGLKQFAAVAKLVIKEG